MDALDQSAELMKVLDRSAALIRHGDALRARSVRIRAAADPRIESSRWRPSRRPFAAGGAPAVDPGPGDSSWLDTKRFEAVRLESQVLRRMSAEVRGRARANRDRARGSRSQHEILRDSAFARLYTKMGTMPVVEQAKGIIMAEQRCGPTEAFDLVRKASQRTNVKLHVLAGQIVEHVASSQNNGNVTPISPAAAQHLRAGTLAQPPAG